VGGDGVGALGAAGFHHGVYNLAFGDVDDDDEIDDYAVTDNGDRYKVLATVAVLVEAYTKRFPDHWILFRGSTEERTRLYRMAIGLHWGELSTQYEIWAYKDEQLISFAKNLKVSAFLIKRKTLYIWIMKQPRKLEDANKLLRTLKTPIPK
jgi:hypothetical protein